MNLDQVEAAALRRLRAWITRAANRHIREMAEEARAPQLPGVPHV